MLVRLSLHAGRDAIWWSAPIAARSWASNIGLGPSARNRTEATEFRKSAARAQGSAQIHAREPGRRHRIQPSGRLPPSVGSSAGNGRVPRSVGSKKILRLSFSVMSGCQPARAVDSTRTQPFIPDGRLVRRRSMTKVSAQWNIHHPGPFSENRFTFSGGLR